MNYFKTLILVCLSGIHLAGYAQVSEKDMKKHRQVLAESRLKKTAVSSLDTLFKAGEAQALVEILARDASTVTEQRIRQIGDHSELIQISRLEKMGETTDRFAYYLFTFPALDLMCEVKSASGGNDLYETIFKHHLLNNGLLDTSRAEIFVVLKGRVNLVNVSGTTTVSKDTNVLVKERGVVVPRDKKAAIVFTSENIEQDRVVIGSYKETSAESPSGTIHKLSIFNTEGALICSATSNALKQHEWSLLTYKDRKFYSVTCTSGNDKEEVIRFLVRQNFL